VREAHDFSCGRSHETSRTCFEPHVEEQGVIRDVSSDETRRRSPRISVAPTNYTTHAAGWSVATDDLSVTAMVRVHDESGSPSPVDRLSLADLCDSVLGGRRTVPPTSTTRCRLWADKANTTMTVAGAERVVGTDLPPADGL
jgi:hypothetical protein